MRRSCFGQNEQAYVGPLVHGRTTLLAEVLGAERAIKSGVLVQLAGTLEPLWNRL